MGRQLYPGRIVLLKANKREGWQVERAKIVSDKVVNGTIMVEVLVKTDGDDGLREVTLDQVSFRVPLTLKERGRFRDLAYQTYNNIGYDSGWNDRTPSKAVFFDVIRDQLHNSDEITDLERALWLTLPIAEKKRIILSVGP